MGDRVALVIADTLAQAKDAGELVEVDFEPLPSATALETVLSPGAPKGNGNALKHGRYTAKAIASRREVAALIRAMRALAGVGDVGG